MSTVNTVHRGFYLDSVALMRLSRQLSQMDGVDDAAVMMGAPANHAILDTAGLLTGAGQSATPGDLVIAIRATSDDTAAAALAAAEGALLAPAGPAGAAPVTRARTLERGRAHMPDANLVLISTPGHYATALAHKALHHGLHVMIFSDNVSIDDEVHLKREAARRNLLVMGPDCGTAIISGVPLAFANRVASGSTGIIGASGTGIQEVSCLIDHSGGGVSHAIGVGGRDLTAPVGGQATLMAIDALAEDDRTDQVVVIAKPPDPDVAARVLNRLADFPHPSIVCFLGAPPMTLPANVRQARTLKDAALLALRRGETLPPPPDRTARHGRIVGLYAGGTLCAEAQMIARDAGLAVRSNVLPVSGAEAGDQGGECVLIELGDVALAVGGPHPMIGPAVRDAPLAAALEDPETAIILLDLILGQGAHPDPAAALVPVLAKADSRPVVLCSVTGTRADIQNRSRQIRTLEDAGVVVAPSNADAARWAV
ncbi:MAG: acyl-CoA synthetase FdrA, partial [Rhodobacteraceae bacterium]|nr:acyl-CoA synthetase FdrA [Paracoccaceae bacterium]